MVEKFIERAKAVAARVSRVADEAAAERLIADERARLGAEHVGGCRD